jgi:predicted nucleic acid-binding protein
MKLKAIQLKSPISAHPLFRWGKWALIVPGVYNLVVLFVVIILSVITIFLPPNKHQHIDSEIYTIVAGFIGSLFVGFFIYLSQNLADDLKRIKSRIFLYESNMLFTLLLNVISLCIWINPHPSVIGWIPLLITLVCLLYSVWTVIHLSTDISAYETARENFLLAVITRAAIEMLELHIQFSRIFTYEIAQYRTNPYIEIRSGVNPRTDYIQFRSPYAGYVVGINERSLHKLYIKLRFTHPGLTHDFMQVPLIILHQGISTERNPEYDSNRLLKDRVSVGDVLVEIRKDIVDQLGLRFFTRFAKHLFTISHVSPASVARGEIATLKYQCLYDLEADNHSSFDSNILMYFHILSNAYNESKQISYNFTAQHQTDTSILDDTQLIHWVLADIAEILQKQDKKDIVRGMNIAYTLGEFGWEIGSATVIEHVIIHYCNSFAKYMTQYTATGIAKKISYNIIAALNQLAQLHVTFILHRRKFTYTSDLHDSISNAYRCLLVITLFHGIPVNFRIIFDCIKTLYRQIPTQGEEESVWPPAIRREMQQHRKKLDVVVLDVGSWLLQHLETTPIQEQDTRMFLMHALSEIMLYLSNTELNTLLHGYRQLRKTEHNKNNDSAILYAQYGDFLLSHREMPLDRFIILILVQQVASQTLNVVKQSNRKPNEQLDEQLINNLRLAINLISTNKNHWNQYSQLVSDANLSSVTDFLKKYVALY